MSWRVKPGSLHAYYHLQHARCPSCTDAVRPSLNSFTASESCCTAGVAGTFFLYLVSQHPEVEARLLAELDSLGLSITPGAAAAAGASVRGPGQAALSAGHHQGLAPMNHLILPFATQAALPWMLL